MLTWQAIKLYVLIACTAFFLWIYIRMWKNRRQLHSSQEWLVEDAGQFAGCKPDDVVTIGRFANPLDAHTYRVRLQSSGIDTVVFGEKLMSYREGIELRVRAKDAQLALELLNTTEPDMSE